MAPVKRKIIDWGSLSKWEKAVMVVMLPIFAVVAGVEHVIAKLTGLTYNEVNIIVYFLLIPFSWTVMIDYIAMLPFLTPMYLISWVIFLWKDSMKFRARCDWMFEKSVDFLLWFKKISWNYVVSSVIICVIVPVLIYVELIWAINNK